MITVTPCRLPPLKSLHPTNRFQWAGPSDFQAICGRGPITPLTGRSIRRAGSRPLLGEHPCGAPAGCG